MKNTEVVNMLMDIPTKLCRNMNQRFINSFLKEIKSDFSHHHFMILKLLEENRLLYVAEVVADLSITKPQMTASADKLIQLGYIERKYDVDDRRKIYLSITESGIEITNRIKRNINVHINNNLVNLSEKEQIELENGLKILFKFCSFYK